MTTRTQAAVLRKCKGHFKIEDVEIDDPIDDEILVRIVACGICHTDIAAHDGTMAWHFPCVLGHEGAGIVEKVGKKVVSLRPGDKVLLSFNSCGKCKHCKAKHPAHCLKFDELNFSWLRPNGSPMIWDAKGKSIGGNLMGQSSFGYFALTHERNAIRTNVKMDELALFACLGCGIQAGAGTVLHELKPKKNETLAVFGTGSVGLAAVMAARLAGVRTIIAVDIVPKRLKLAKELGAHMLINSKKEKFEIPVDHVVETTGNIRVIQQALRFLNPRGKISLLGISSSGRTPKKRHPQQTIIESIAGDSYPQEFLPFLISCYKKGKFPFDKLIRFYPAAEINSAVKDSVKGSAIKPVLVF